MFKGRDLVTDYRKKITQEMRSGKKRCVDKPPWPISVPAAGAVVQ